MRTWQRYPEPMLLQRLHLGVRALQIVGVYRHRLLVSLFEVFFNPIERDSSQAAGTKHAAVQMAGYQRLLLCGGGVALYVSACLQGHYLWEVFGSD